MPRRDEEQRTPGLRPAKPVKPPRRTRPILISAFQSDGIGSGITLEDVFMVDSVSGALTPVAPDPDSSVVMPAWSPDGTRIALCTSAPGPHLTTKVLDRSGAEQESFARGYWPQWYDSQTLLVYESFILTVNDVSIVTAEFVAVHLPTATITQVTRFGPDLVIGSAHWHPTAGLALAVRPGDADPGAQERIMIATATRVQDAIDGGAPVAASDLTVLEPFGPGAVCFQPSWSPDGARLAFACRAVASPVTGLSDIAVLDLATGNARVLHAHGDPLPEPPLPAGQVVDDYSPVFSPDGRMIAWNHGYYGDWREVWVMAADGTAKRQLTQFGRQWVVASLDW